MGTFCDYNGNMTIPDEFKDEFNENNSSEGRNDAV